MKYLPNWLLRLASFIAKLFRKINRTDIIPDKIAETELIIRGVFTPLFYSQSKKKLKEGAFLPPPGKNDVSVLRHDFTNDNFCKNHCLGIAIKDNTYCGLASFLAKHITELTKEHNIEGQVYLKITPLEDDLRTIVEKRPILKTFKGVPMHADLYYTVVFQAGKPNTTYRRFAKDLAIKISNYFEYPYPAHKSWQGNKLGWS